jgi:glycogen debranching enzyme
VGFFLQAKLKFFDYKSVDEAKNNILKHLLPHQDHMQQDPWRSLPELTNSNGKFCVDSCRAQTWSVATILDAVHDLNNFKVKN